MKILWLEDDLEAIEYEAYILLPEVFKDLEVETFQTIANLIDYINQNDISDVIFLIDLMLIGESRYICLDKKEKFIKNELVAGYELYQTTLKNFDNKVIFYTSRTKDKNLDILFNDEKFNKTIFFIEKDKKDTELLKILKKILMGQI